jgi:hypothetical protein
VVYGHTHQYTLAALKSLRIIEPTPSPSPDPEPEPKNPEDMDPEELRAELIRLRVSVALHLEYRTLY